MIKEFFKVVLYKPLFNLLTFFAWLVPGHSIGWAIILLTLTVRGILWVPSVKGLKVPLQLRRYQGEMKALQEKHKDDRQAQAQALMAFYKEKGVNPMSGCLPLLVQLPIILILYRVFMAGLKDVRPDLLYSITPHLTSINHLFFGLDLSRPDKIFLPAIAALSQYLQSRHFAALNPPTATKSDDPTAMMNKQMQYLFPIMTYFVTFSLPAGLALYWTATSLFSWAQQIYVAKTFKFTDTGAKVTVRSRRKS